MFASMEILNPIKLTVKLTSLSPHMDQLGEAGGGRYRPNFLAHPVYTVLHSTMMMEPLWKSVHFQLFSFLLSTVLWVISRIINLSSACLCSSLWEILCPPPPGPLHLTPGIQQSSRQQCEHEGGRAIGERLKMARETTEMLKQFKRREDQRWHRKQALPKLVLRTSMAKYAGSRRWDRTSEA